MYSMFIVEIYCPPKWQCIACFATLQTAKDKFLGVKARNPRRKVRIIQVHRTYSPLKGAK